MNWLGLAGYVFSVLFLVSAFTVVILYASGALDD